MIRVENLRCGYPGHDVLQGISFRVGRGEFIGVLGPNGAGKTTLLLALTGILPVPEGTVEIDGMPLDEMKTRDLALRVAAVSQDAEVRLPFACEEIVRMGRYPHQKRWQMDSAEDREAVEKAMRATDSLVLAGRPVTGISGGERQRVFMARALAQEASVLLLDEATSAMDIHRKMQAFRVLDRLNREEGLTVLAVMHDVNLAALFCRRMIFLKEGRVEADGPTAAVLAPEVLEAVYQTRVLVQEVADTGKRQVVFLP
ncbi:MAG: ABC transporter ATP-binding protein [Syntrophobacteraceae bacterium]